MELKGKNFFLLRHIKINSQRLRKFRQKFPLKLQRIIKALEPEIAFLCALSTGLLHSRHTVCSGMALVSLERWYGDYAHAYTCNIPKAMVFGSFMEI